MNEEYLLINGTLYRKVESMEKIFNGKICPLCGGDKLIEQPGDETFHSRVGCLICDRWLEPLRLKEKG